MKTMGGLFISMLILSGQVSIVLAKKMHKSSRLQSCGTIRDTHAGTVTPHGNTMSTTSECEMVFDSPGAQYLDVGGAQFRTPSDGAFTLVANITKATSSVYDVLFDAAGIRFGFYLNEVYMWKSGYKVFTGAVTLGTPTVVALSFDGTQTFEAFVDGVSKGTYVHSPGTYLWGAPGDFQIGAGIDSSGLVHYFEGKISYVRQFDYVMTGSQTVASASGLALFDVNAGQSAPPSAVGDPHLTNLRGEKFDIHDGLHRLVHFPRKAPEDQALLMIDVKAVDMGHDSDCYSVYLQSVKLSGKWVGEEVTVGVDAKNSSAASLSPSAFFISFADMRMDWPSLAKQHDVPLTLKGSMPVMVTSGVRKASGQDAMGGEDIAFKIGGNEHPVSVQVWSSSGKNQLTHDKEVRYLNVEVQNLPKNSGGIIGLDSYSRPSNSHCDLIQEERDLASYIKADNADMSLLGLSISRPQWTASASPQK